MKRLIKNFCATIGVKSGLNEIYERTVGRTGLRVVLYHVVRASSPQWRFYPYYVTPEVFVRQVDFLRQKYTVVPIRRVLEAMDARAALPDNALVLTFDDGSADFYDQVYPVLAQRGLPATLFVTTGPVQARRCFWWDAVAFCLAATTKREVDFWMEAGIPIRGRCVTERERWSLSAKLTEHFFSCPPERQEQDLETMHRAFDVGRDQVPRTALTWEQIEEIDRAGLVTWGGHTVNHPDLTRLPLAQASTEITQGMDELRARLRNWVPAFSYPGGRYNPDLEGLLRELGFGLAFTTVNQLNKRVAGPKPCTLHRVSAQAWDSLDTFRVKVSGFYRCLLKRCDGRCG